MKLFQTTVHRGKIADKKMARELLKEAYQWKSLDDSGKAWSKKNYPKGFSSYGSLDDMHRRSSTFTQLEKKLDRAVASFAKGQGWDLGGAKLAMSTCWFNIMHKGSFHSAHIHPLSVVSGTFYLATPPKCGDIKFEDPRMAHFMNEPSVPRHVSLRPKAGEFVLFNSWLRHEVTQNNSDKDRVSVSFNYEWAL